MHIFISPPYWLGFAEADDGTEPVPLPSGLTGFQRAMVHQYCDELGVKLSSKGAEPNRCMLLIKVSKYIVSAWYVVSAQQVHSKCTARIRSLTPSRHATPSLAITH